MDSDSNNNMGNDGLVHMMSEGGGGGHPNAAFPPSNAPLNGAMMDNLTLGGNSNSNSTRGGTLLPPSIQQGGNGSIHTFGGLLMNGAAHLDMQAVHEHWSHQ
jgi:hypothetical protein